MVLTSILDPVFRPLLSLQPWAAILIISGFLTLISTLVYKFTTPQARLKELKNQLKEYQDKLKKLSKDNPKKAMDLQKKAMELNMEYMKHSFKPMLYTFIPIILIFGWLQAHMIYESISPGVPFEVQAKFKVGAGTPVISAYPEGIVFISNTSGTINEKKMATWTMKGNPGAYKLTISYEGESAERDVFITNEFGKYESPLFRPKSQSVTEFNVKNDHVHPLGSFSLFGWLPGCIGFYIISSMLFSFGFRRLLNLS